MIVMMMIIIIIIITITIIIIMNTVLFTVSRGGIMECLPSVANLYT
jgi:hypothetical protein